MQNITIVNNGIIAGFSPENKSGIKNATVDKIIAHTGNNFVNKLTIIYILYYWKFL